MDAICGHKPPSLQVDTVKRGQRSIHLLSPISFLAGIEDLGCPAPKYNNNNNNTMTETKITLEGIKRRITEAEERISKLEDRMVEFTAMEQNKEKRMKRNEDRLRDLWDNIKCTNIRIIGVPEGEEREKGPKKIFEEIMIENYPNMGKEIATQVEEAHRVPGSINPKRNRPRHIVIKLTKLKAKEKLLKVTREK